LALPLAASKGEMPLAQEVQKRMAETITTKNVTFLLMVKSFTCLKKIGKRKLSGDSSEVL
jgi:hypothetical protein